MIQQSSKELCDKFNCRKLLDFVFLVFFTNMKRGEAELNVTPFGHRPCKGAYFSLHPKAGRTKEFGDIDPVRHGRVNPLGHCGDPLALTYFYK
jgi:hypothetical protein